jgi:hypothetical protein
MQCRIGAKLFPLQPFYVSGFAPSTSDSEGRVKIQNRVYHRNLMSGSLIVRKRGSFGKFFAPSLDGFAQFFRKLTSLVVDCFPARYEGCRIFSDGH